MGTKAATFMIDDPSPT